MTDEERRKLIKDLDGISHDEEGVDDYVAERCLAAADEIERLALLVNGYRTKNETLSDELEKALSPVVCETKRWGFPDEDE